MRRRSARKAATAFILVFRLGRVTTARRFGYTRLRIESAISQSSQTALFSWDSRSVLDWHEWRSGSMGHFIRKQREKMKAEQRSMLGRNSGLNESTEKSSWRRASVILVGLGFNFLLIAFSQTGVARSV